MSAPVELYGTRTGNCLRAAIALEEAGIPYRVRHVDLKSEQQHDAGYLSLNPMGKVPTIVDHGAGEPPFVLAQSNAIILYAAEKAPGSLIPHAPATARALVYERFFLFVTDVIAPSHAAFFLQGQGAGHSAVLLNERALSSLSAAERYVAEAPFMAGDSFSIADIAAFTFSMSVKQWMFWKILPNLDRWYRTVEARPAVKRGLAAFDQTSNVT